MRSLLFETRVHSEDQIKLVHQRSVIRSTSVCSRKSSLLKPYLETGCCREWTDVVMLNLQYNDTSEHQKLAAIRRW